MGSAVNEGVPHYLLRNCSLVQCMVQSVVQGNLWTSSCGTKLYIWRHSARFMKRLTTIHSSCVCSFTASHQMQMHHSALNPGTYSAQYKSTANLFEPPIIAASALQTVANCKPRLLRQRTAVTCMLLHHLTHTCNLCIAATSGNFLYSVNSRWDCLS